MADEKPIERTYNVPLRKEFLKVPKHKRAKKAVTALKQFLVKHMKSENIKVGAYVNKEIWKRGIKSPPHHVKVNVTKDKEGLVNAELVGAPVETPKEEKETKEAKSKKDSSALSKKGSKEESKKDSSTKEESKKDSSALPEKGSKEESKEKSPKESPKKDTEKKDE